MRLWSLQAVIVVLMLAVGLAVANAPQVRSAPTSLKKMCAAPGQDEIAKGACAEFSGE